MTNKAMERFPIVEKTIPLSREEYGRLMRSHSINEGLKESVLDLLIKARTKIADREEAMWDGLAQQFGFEDNLSLQSLNKVIEISWANRQINLRSGGQDAPPQI